MNSESCFFCNVRDNLSNNLILFENDLFIAKYSGVPVNPGHIELFPRRHIETLLDLNHLEKRELVRSIGQTQDMLSRVDFEAFYKLMLLRAGQQIVKNYAQKMLQLSFINNNPTGFNVGINQGVSAGQTVKHLHIHLIPRFDGDTPDPIGGVRNLLNNGLGNYKALF